MNLILDFGNTYRKMALVEKKEIVLLIPHVELKDIIAIGEKQSVENAILSSVVNHTEEIEDYLQHTYPFIKLSDTTPIPVQNEYKTRSTLGNDRLACAVAAQDVFPQTDVLVLQLGTCITADFVSRQGVYLGGSISPGLAMRFKALHSFSARLPMVEYKDSDFITGETTEESILSGVINGIIAECNYIIGQYKTKYPQLKIILTGGDTKKFENRIIKRDVYAFPNLVISGLDLIVRYNAKK
jgi:type III pantothenate kinase